MTLWERNGYEFSSTAQELSAHCSGGHTACRRAEASCPAAYAYALERSQTRLKRCSGRQDARPLRQAGCPPLPTNSGLRLHSLGQIRSQTR